jgi:hypothetical protein
MKQNYKQLKPSTPALLLLFLLLALTLIPTTANAASVSISPTKQTVYAGATVTIKPSGSYKSVKYTSSKTSVATVSSKGKVTAKKAGTTTISVKFTLKNKKTTTKKCTITVKAMPSDTITVTSANAAAAQQIAAKLDAGSAFNILVTASSQGSAKKVMASLQTLVGQQNDYGVIFQYNDDCTNSNGTAGTAYPSKTNPTGYIFAVTKNDCLIYQYAKTFWSKLLDIVIGDTFYDGFDADENPTFDVNGRLAFARSCSSWQDYAAKCRSININPHNITNVNNDYQYRVAWQLANMKLKDMSQAMKVWLLSQSSYFSTAMNEEWKSWGCYGMIYSEKGSQQAKKESTVSRMKNAATNNAYGVCADFVYYEMTVLEQVGITAEYIGGTGHAYAKVKATNTDGKALVLCFDYYLDYGTRNGYCKDESLVY